MRKLIIGIAIGAVLAGTTAAVASIPSSDGTIHACRATKGGALRAIDSEAGQQCDPKTEAALTWNQTGPQGPAGPQGPQGEPGPQGPAGPAGANGIGSFYHRSADFPNVTGSPVILRVSCDSGDVAIRGQATVSYVYSDHTDTRVVALLFENDQTGYYRETEALPGADWTVHDVLDVLCTDVTS